jgi:hypothetical protein
LFPSDDRKFGHQSLESCQALWETIGSVRSLSDHFEACPGSLFGLVVGVVGATAGGPDDAGEKNYREAADHDKNHGRSPY